MKGKGERERYTQLKAEFQRRARREKKAFLNDTAKKKRKTAYSEEKLKILLMKVKEESEKAGLILNIQNSKIMASSPITSWQIDGETVETVTGFIFLGSKITADADCSHEIKRLLLL